MESPCKQIKTFFSYNAPAYATFFTLKTILTTMGLSNKKGLLSYELFAMVHEFALLTRTSCFGVFFYRMIQYFRKKAKFEEKIDYNKIVNSVVFETL